MTQADAVESEISAAMTNKLRTDGIKCIKLLGKGSYSTVKLAWYEHMQKLVAVKLVDKRSGSDFVVRFLPREMQVVRTLNHSNIIKVFSLIEIHPFTCMVEEYAANGDLLQKIKRYGRINEDDSKFYFRQLIEALIYLKSLEVVHRDLKCENVFLDSCDNVKLGDFGFSRYMHEGDESRTFCGSRAYTAPEVLRSRPYKGFAVDIWSAGVVLYVMVTGLMPYDDRYPKKMLLKQLQHRITFPSKRTLSDEVKRLIFEMLHPVPTKRKQYPDIIKCSWLVNTTYRMRIEEKLSPPSTDSSDD
uniref:Protein kinase domain-containing protein n=2 Tax=Parascaris univalens TaxID=6257 RepID=A0A915ATX1_PARUN